MRNAFNLISSLLAFINSETKAMSDYNCHNLAFYEDHPS